MNLKGQCCLMSSYRRWGVKSQMLQFCKSNFGSVLNIRKFSNLLQVSGLWMYQVPLVYTCAGSKGSAGTFFSYTALCQLTKSDISPQSVCVTLLIPAWRRRWRQGQAGPCLRATGCSVQVGQPQHEICPWNKAAARDGGSAESEKPCWYESSVTTFPLVWSSAWRLYEKVFFC